MKPKHKFGLSSQLCRSFVTLKFSLLYAAINPYISMLSMHFYGNIFQIYKKNIFFKNIFLCEKYIFMWKKREAYSDLHMLTSCKAPFSVANEIVEHQILLLKKTFVLISGALYIPQILWNSIHLIENAWVSHRNNDLFNDV
jgi:hypothetical protein